MKYEYTDMIREFSPIADGVTEMSLHVGGSVISGCISNRLPE